MMEIKKLFNGVQRKKDFSMDLGSSGLETLLAASSDFFKPLFLQDSRAMAYLSLQISCLAPATAPVPNPSASPLPPLHWDKPTGRPSSAPAPGYFGICHQKSAKKLPRRASKEQNHYLITINLNKNGL